METTEKKGISRQTFGLVILALLIVNSLTLYLFYTERQAKETTISNKEVVEKDYKRLTEDFDLRNVELEKFKGKNAELDKAITQQQEEIKMQRRTIESLLAKNNLSKAEYNKAMKMIANYEITLDELNLKIEELSMQNQQLASANQDLSVNLANEKSLGLTQQEKINALNKKVDEGSLLQLTDLDVKAVRSRITGREVTVRRAKNAESLRITFETGDNRILDPGTLSLFVRIINPKGETIAIADKGSGTIKMNNSEEQMMFTKKADLDWNQSNKKVTVYWTDQINAPGKYTVEVYQNGYVIGKKEVELS